MNKEESYLKLENITKLFNILGYISNIDLEIKDIDFNNKKYSIKKDKDTFIISSSDNRLLILKMKFENSISIACPDMSIATIEYYFPDNTILKYSKEIGNSISYDNFKNFEVSKLTGDLSFPFIDYYIVDKDYNVAANYSLDDFELNNVFFTFTSKGIQYCNEYLVSKDGKRLLAIDYDTKCLTIEDVREFDYKKEKEKIINLLKNDKTLHPYSKMIIKEAISELKEKAKEAKVILKFYKEDIPLCIEIVDIRKKIINNLKNYTFTEDELFFIIQILVQTVKNQNENNKIKRLKK